MQAWLSRLDPKVSRWGLALFGVALLIRLIGISWGLPSAERFNSLHPDEDLILGYSQTINPAAGKFTTGFYNYATLYLTLDRVGTIVSDAYAPTGEVKTPADAARLRAKYMLVGRWISALAGAATVWVVFALLCHRVHDWAALAGALAVAVAPGHVMHSRFQTVDVLGAFFVVLSLYWAARWLPPGEEQPDKRSLWRYALYAGACAGLAAGTKYTGVLALVGLFVASVVVGSRTRDWKSAIAPFAGACLASVVVFLLTTPGAVLEPTAFLRDFKYELLHTSQGHGLVFAGTSSGFIYHVMNLFLGFSFLLTLAGAFGLVWGSVRKHAWIGVFLAFAVCYYILIGRAEVKFFRYVLPLIPVLAVGVGWVFDRFHTNPNPKWRPANLIVICGLAGIGGGGLASAAVWSNWMASQDPRDTLGQEMKGKATDGTTVGLVSDAWFYTPTLFPEVAEPRAVPFLRRLATQNSQTHPRILQFVPENPDLRKAWDSRLVTELQPDFIVYSSFETEGLATLAEMNGVPAEFRAQVADFKSFMQALTTDYTESEEFRDNIPTVHDLMYIRPVLYVWKRKTPSDATPTGSSTTSSSREGPAATP